MTPTVQQKASSFFLQDKIIIETMNQRDAGTWYSSGLVTVLPVTVTDIELGQCVLNHLSWSKVEIIPYERIRNSWNELIKKAGYKTEKAFMRDVRRVTVIIEGDILRLEPYKANVAQKTFYRILDGIKSITPIPEVSLIGNELRKSGNA